MSKTIKRVVSGLLVVASLASVCFTAIACSKDEPESLIPVTTTGKDNVIVTPNTEGGEYTYRGYTTALGTNWNPHTWETNADDSIASYTTSPFVTMSIKDSKNGVYQWVYEMATSIKDVTKDNKGDLTKYNVTLQSGKTAETTEAGYVYEIALNPNAKWEDGTKITADDYIYSMQMLLNSKMRNYRSNLYWSGESAVAGGLEYYNSEAPIYAPIVPAYGSEDTPDYSFDMDAAIAAGTLYVNVTSESMTLYGESLTALNSNYIDDAEIAATLKAWGEDANVYGYTKITAENKEAVFNTLKKYAALFGIDPASDDAMYIVMEALFYNTGKFGEKVEYDKVGCYKVDDYTIRYVCQTYIDVNYFLTSCTSTWLVHKDLYEKNMDKSGELTTTKYGTSKDTYMSYGPYKIESIQKDKQIIFTRNENWYGWQKDEKGNLFSMTNFDVDGKKVRQYETTRVVIDVMDDEAAKLAFLKGELSEWAPPATELSKYTTSEQMYKADETYTMSFFFNTNVDHLKEMDKSKGNTNSVVLSNINFRKAMSLAIDRAEYVTATAGYKPAFSLLNGLYYYDVYNDPTSSYRQTEEAMKAIVNLYGVEYGEGKAYKTLKEAHDSITGYNLDEAKKLMKTACDELVAEGLYTKGGEIKIRIGWAKGALTPDDNAQVALMNKYVNAALEGSGFGKITFEAIGSIEDRYGDVPKGEYAIGYGAWGGAAFYPFRNFNVYCDPDAYDINEAACWDPTTEELTLKVNGEDVTMTWQDWSNSMMGNGPYTEADFETKLQITAAMEELYLKKFYRIPLAGTAICSLLSYQCKYYTQDYNIMYGYGGLRLMTYTYNDADWAKYVAAQPDGKLNYE